MAKYADGTNYAKSIDPSSTNIVDPGILGGKVRVMQDVATVTAATNLNSSGYFIVGKKLPTGAQVISIQLANATTALSTNNHIIVGDEGDDNRYFTSLQLATAGPVFFGPNAAAGMNYVVTGATDNYIRIAGAVNASIISSGTIGVTVLYTVE